MDIYNNLEQSTTLRSSLVNSSCTNIDIVANVNGGNCAGSGQQEDDLDQLPDVRFDVSSDFNLDFFDTTEDSSIQGAFSDPGSVESVSVGSPPPVAINRLLLQDDSDFLQSDCLASSIVHSGAGNKTDPQFAAADSNSNGSVVKTFVPCKVCGDKASGYHYGVTSCEGCKGFFRRSIQKQIEYRCLRDGKCLVIRLNRNRCQYCRFKKCLSAGMSRDSVRYGRVPKRSRELNGSDDTSIRVSTPGTPNTPTTPQMCSVASPPELGCTATIANDAEIPGSAELSVYDVILCVSQAHRSHCTYTEEQTRELVRRPIILPQSSVKDECEIASLSETIEEQKIWLWQQYAARITPGVQHVVEFAKRVPGFCDFTQDDQLILIKLGFFEVWLTHVARMITGTSLTFDDGAYLMREHLEIIYDNDFVVSLQNFSNAINSYNLSDTEIGLFSAMVLLASDRSGITEHKIISRTRERIAEALRVQIVRSRPGSTNSLQLMPALEAKILELRALGAKHCSHLDWLRNNWTKLRLPPLFAEIFDIPKTDDDI